MKFEAVNLKDTFKVWKITLFMVLIAFTVLALLYIIGEWPESSFDPFFGYRSGFNRNNPEHKFILGLTSLLPVADIALLVFIVLLSKWEKDAKRYGLIVEGTQFDILCNGRRVTLETHQIDRFDILAKNSEPTLFKSKWTDVGYIVSGQQMYKLYYLKNIQQAKMIFESNRKYQETQNAG